MAQKEVIIKNFKEYMELADYAFSRAKYNGAVTLYYKALVELCDFVLLEKTGQAGSNHTERFNLLKDKDPELYDVASKLFTFYRDSYSLAITRGTAEQVKTSVENAKKQYFTE